MRLFHFVRLLAAALLLASAASLVAKPKVVIVSMGGTIDSKGDTRLNVSNYGGRGNRVGPEAWLAELPELQQLADVTAEDLRAAELPPGVTGGGTTFERLFIVAKRLQELADDASVDGIVVTHGTNTLAETAWFMHLTVAVDKPVVFVGSQRPWTALSGDGPMNLYQAVRVASSPEASGMGVLHVMNDTINGAREVTKTSAYRLETFKSVDTGPLGFTDADRIVIYEKPLRRHTRASEFNIRSLPEKLPPVEILYAYTESPGYLVDAAVETGGVKGLIIDGTGAGALAGGQSDAVKRAQAKGVVVVATARTRGGRVQETVRRTEAKIVPGDNLPPEKARILLMLALTKTTELSEIKRIFDQY
jgi:L-asparaginase type II